MSIYNYITIASVIFLIILILIQTRGASLGAGLGGGGGEINIERRGSDKSLHQLTIIVALVFVGSIVLGIVS
jgi:protein translocase SecG subunit